METAATIAPYLLWTVTTLVAVGVFLQQVRQAKSEREDMRNQIAERATQKDLDRVEGNVTRLERRFDEGPVAVVTALEMIDRRLQRIESLFDEHFFDG